MVEVFHNLEAQVEVVLNLNLMELQVLPDKVMLEVIQVQLVGVIHLPEVVAQVKQVLMELVQAALLVMVV
jgi:hypothetical protein